MLSWVGKRPLREVRSFPAQLVERFAPPTPDDVVSDAVDWSDWPDRFDRSGLLFHGDNKEVIAHLLANGFRGKVDLVYIDPPFDSGADYVRKVQLRGASGSARLDGADYTLGEQIQYTDIWANDTYLQFMYERLLLLKELLRESGVIYVHSDHRKDHHLRMLLDEVMGAENYLNTVSWRSQVPRGAKVTAFFYPYSTHFIHIFAKNKAAPPVWNPQKKQIRMTEEDAERDYSKDDGGYFRTSDPGTYSFDSLRRLHQERRLYVTKGGEVVVDEQRRVVHTTKGTIGIKYYLRPDGKGGYVTERAIDNLWEDVPGLGTTPGEDLGFPTQKTEGLLRRVIAAASNPGDIVLDCFIGSGTTAAVAQKLGRRWIGADINKGAIQTTEKRLAAIIDAQIAAGGGEQLTIEAAADAPPKPAQTSFTVHRVNDYDLQIQHNEAVELAVEHLGISRTRTDAFFTGTLGKELAYVVPFDHPTTVLDLQAVARELDARPTVELDVVVVGLGLELATQAWLENHNRHRPVNKVRVIDLRTDPKHGRFFEHRPASGRVSFERADGRIRVRIDDFMSPSILERLSGEQGILAPSIDDWRSMVDSVAIDAAYDGEVFDVDMIDIPARRSDLVEGSYDLATPAVGADRPAAVRITDMLGEEILLVEDR